MSTEKADERIPWDLLVPGAQVRVHFLSQEGDQLRETVFEGIVIAHKHGREPGATITVRKESYGVGVEKIFPLHSPLLKKIEVVRLTQVRRAKLYYLRARRGKRARLKTRYVRRKSAEGENTSG